MEPLSPCGSCRRHVRASSSACPFCKAPRAAAALAVALALAGCDRAPAGQPDAGSKAEVQELQRQIEQHQREIEEQKRMLERAQTLYGAPPRLGGSAPAASGSGRPAGCPPGDPLCGL